MHVENGPVSPKPSRSRYAQNDFIMEDQKRKRTQAWAEQQILLPSQPSMPKVKKRAFSITPKVILIFLICKHYLIHVDR
jgi:hypothetical protein